MYLSVYVSSATELFTEEALTALLEKSRQNNLAADITGMLLYRDGNFMQLLEGPKDAVQALVAKIKLDPRHRGLIVLLDEEHAGREFPEWSMGFRKLSPQTPADVPGYTNFLNLPFNSSEFVDHPSKSLNLLLHFKRAMG